MASRFGRGFRGASRRCSFQSTHNGSFTSNYTRFASASSFGQNTSTPTITMSYPQSFGTPACMVYSSISLTQTMEEGSHLIGTGSTSSALAEEEEEGSHLIGTGSTSSAL